MNSEITIEPDASDTARSIVEIVEKKINGL